MVVYWLQRASGFVIFQSGYAYTRYDFTGTPEEFKANVREKLGREVDVWFGGQATEPPEAIAMLQDQAWRLRLAVERSGNIFSFAWIQSSDDSFRTVTNIDLTSNNQGRDMSVQPPQGINTTLADDQLSATISIDADGQNVCTTLDALNLDRLIAHLAEVRRLMAEPVSLELAAGTQLAVVVDPVWRTHICPHPSARGILLALRHPGFGWISFLLLSHEAEGLGRWLTDNVP